MVPNHIATTWHMPPTRPTWRLSTEITAFAFPFRFFRTSPKEFLKFVVCIASCPRSPSVPVVTPSCPCEQRTTKCSSRRTQEQTEQPSKELPDRSVPLGVEASIWGLVHQTSVRCSLSGEFAAGGKANDWAGRVAGRGVGRLGEPIQFRKMP